MPKPARLEGIPPFEGVFPKSYSFYATWVYIGGAVHALGMGLQPFFPVAVLNPREA